LLAGDHRIGSSAKLRNIFQRLRRRSQSSVLPFQYGYDPLSSFRRILNEGAFVFGPIKKVRRAWVKPLNIGSEFEVIEEKASGMRYLAEWKTLRIHRRSPRQSWIRHVMVSLETSLGD